MERTNALYLVAPECLDPVGEAIAELLRLGYIEEVIVDGEARYRSIRPYRAPRQ